jgi:hypothetical protein
VALTFADDFDELDQQYAESLVSDDAAFVTQMITVVKWMDDEGDERWRCYVASGQGERVATCVGLLEFAKVDLMTRGDVFPVRASSEDDDGE